MRCLKLVAIDLDGPLLVDSFSPILYRTCQHYGWEYDREFERNTLSRRRSQAIAYIRDHVAADGPAEVRDQSDQALAESYFRFRTEFLEENPLVVQPGAAEFLQRLAGRDVTLVCYGGLDEDYMRRELGALGDLFDRYVCTNDFRPGVHEIVHDIYGVRPQEALFLDDVAYVAEAVRDVGAAFIGVPSCAPWSWQRADMETAEMPFLVPSLGEVDDPMLDRVDALCAEGCFWATPPEPHADRTERSAAGGPA